MKNYFLISLVFLFCFYTTSVDASQSLFYFKSTPGDYIGQGEEKLYNENITVERNYDNGVSFSIFYSSDWWYLNFAAKNEETLVEGVYENATRFPSLSQPGLSLYGCGRGCNMSYGRFEVMEAFYDGSGNVISFAADFEQHCEHLDAPPLYGAIRYNSEIPFTIPTTTTTIAALYFKSTPGDYIGQGEEKIYNENITVERNYDNGVSFSVDYGMEWWNLDFAAPYSETLVEGIYENATRFPFQTSSQPGLSFYGSGRGCNTLYGRFEVMEAVYDGNGNVISFAADFEQHCEQPNAPPLYGAVRYNSEIPINVSTSITTSTPVTTTTTTVPPTTTVPSTTTTVVSTTTTIPESFTKLAANGYDLPDSATSWVMVRDNATGLIWEVKTDDGTVSDKDNQFDWYNAAVFISSLNAANFGGFSDWRLPTVKELSYIVKRTNTQPSINTSYFPNTVASIYWTAEACVPPKFSDSVWGVSFNNGTVRYYPKVSLYYVRAVRGSGSFNNFIDNGDGTVTDMSTGLMWQQAWGPEMTRQAARTYCENLSLANYTDWRLPNINELISIIDYNRFGPAIDTKYFLNTPKTLYFWSDTNSYCVYSYYGFVDIRSVENSYYVRAVRNAANTTSTTSLTTTTIPITSITLSNFTVEPSNRKAIVIWSTESEIDNAGFNLYRSEAEDGEYIKINSSLIPAQGFSTQGASYEFVDKDVKNRKKYWYKLEDIDLNGVSTFHGPVSATPRLIFGLSKYKQ